MTDLEKVLARLDALSNDVTYLVERQRAQEELLAEMTPIARAMMATATERLGALEQDGYFAFGKELLGVLDRIVKAYSPADVQQLADSIVQILDAVRAATQPAAMEMLTDAAAATEDVDKVEPLGVFGLARATRNPDVGRGIAVMVEVLRRVGRGLGAAKERADEKAAQREKLAAILGPRRNRALGVERQLPAGKRTAAAPPAAAPPVATEPAAPPACAVPRAPAQASVVLDGIAYTKDGHLVDATAWTRPLGEAIATAEHVVLSPAHWQIIEAAQRDFAATKSSPNLRRLTQVAAVSTKDLYALFPKAPGRTIAKIAGLPKPAGCL